MGTEISNKNSMAGDLESSSTSTEHIASVSTARAGRGKKKAKTIPTHELSPERSEEGLSGVSGTTEKPAELSVIQLAQIAALVNGIMTSRLHAIPCGSPLPASTPDVNKDGGDEGMWGRIS